MRPRVARARSCRPPRAPAAARPALPARTALQERPDRGVEPVSVEPAEQPANRRLRRTPPIHPERGGGVGGQVSDPLGDRDERPGTRRDRTHRGRQHHDQPMADTATLARIGYLGQRGRAGPAPARPDRVAAAPPPDRRRQRSDKDETRARLSSDDQGWRENRHDHHQRPCPHPYLDRVSPQLSARSPRLCRPPAARGHEQRGAASIPIGRAVGLLAGWWALRS